LSDHTHVPVDDIDCGDYVYERIREAFSTDLFAAAVEFPQTHDQKRQAKRALPRF